MENFFKYISKPIPSDDVDVWFKINNIIPEKMELFSDFSYSLNMLIVETYLGENNTSETKIVLSNEDVEKHFQWCFNKVIEIGEFFNELFDIKKPFTKSDLDMIGVIYKLLDKNLEI